MALACFALLSMPQRSQAEATRKIVVMPGYNKPAFVSRVRAELGSLGFDVAVGAPPTFPPSRSEIEQLAQQEHANAALVLIEAGGGVEFCVIDPETGKTTFREVILGFYDPDEAPEVVAIRVVETLRATLKSVQSAPTPAPSEPRSAKNLDLPTNAPTARFTLGVGGGAGYSAGGVGPVGHLTLSVEWAMMLRVSLAADGAVTPVAATLRGSEGTASLAWYLAGISVRFYASEPNAPVRLRAAVGAWLSIMSFRGQSVSPYVNIPSEFVSAIPHLDVGLRVSVTPRLGLTFDLAGGMSAPSASIRFGDREVATWGRPIWLGNLALEAPLD